MGTEILENEDPYNKTYKGEAPEIQTQGRTFPEPDIIEKAVPVAIDYIKKRVEPQDKLVLLRHHGDVPEYRRAEKEKARDNAHDIGHIGDKEAHGGSYPRQAQKETAGGEHVIEYLQPVKIRHDAVHDYDDDRDDQHDAVKDQAREYFYYGQYCEAKVHFFYQKRIFLEHARGLL